MLTLANHLSSSSPAPGGCSADAVLISTCSVLRSGLSYFCLYTLPHFHVDLSVDSDVVSLDALDRRPETSSV